MSLYNIRIACDVDSLLWNEYVHHMTNSPCYLFYEFRFLIEKIYDAKTLLLIAEDKEKTSSSKRKKHKEKKET